MVKKKKDTIFKNSYSQINVVTSENVPKVICMKIYFQCDSNFGGKGYPSKFRYMDILKQGAMYQNIKSGSNKLGEQCFFIF